MRQAALAAGASEAVVTRHHALGGAGALELAQAVVRVCEGPSSFKFLYELEQPIKVRALLQLRARTASIAVVLVQCVLNACADADPRLPCLACAACTPGPATSRNTHATQCKLYVTLHANALAGQD